MKTQSPPLRQPRRNGLKKRDHERLEFDRILLGKRVAKAFAEENREGLPKKFRRHAILRRHPDPQYVFGLTPPGTGAKSQAGSNTTRTKRNQIKRLILRDGDRCFYCGFEFRSPKQRTRDHIIPLALGGPSCLHNLRLACRPCNGKKAAMDRTAALPRPFGSCPACERVYGNRPNSLADFQEAP